MSVVCPTESSVQRAFEVVNHTAVDLELQAHDWSCDDWAHLGTPALFAAKRLPPGVSQGVKLEVRGLLARFAVDVVAAGVAAGSIDVSFAGDDVTACAGTDQQSPLVIDGRTAVASLRCAVDAGTATLTIK